MSFLTGLKQVVGTLFMMSTVPAAMATEHFGAQYLQKCYPAEETISHKIGDVLQHEGISYKILGFSGHAKSTIENFDTTSGREVWYGPLDTAQEYAKMNAAQREPGVVAVLGQVIGAPAVPVGDSRYANGFAPILPQKEHQVKVIYQFPVNSRTDITIKASLDRFIVNKTNKLETLLSKVQIVTSKNFSCPSEYDVWLAPILVKAK